jgi:hypothetical protein
MPGYTLPLDKLADVWFPTKNKKIPINWQQPMASPGRDHFPKAFTIAEMVGGGPSSPRPYYFNATPNKYHGDAAKDVSKWHQEFIHKALNNIKGAIDSWRAKAKLKDLKVMSVCAIGAPGCLDAPDIKNEPSFSSWQGKEDNEKKYIKAVVTGFSKKWMEWAGKVMVPGLPWYPAFAAFPLASAPPMPNIPMPLITCPSAMMASLAVFAQIKDAMVKELDGGVKDKDKDKQHEAIFETIAFPLATNFLLWLVSQQIMNCLGKGPVPPYAPPYVPVGPVVGGDNIAAPGHIAG